jgi:hypothetical protein
MIKVINKSTHLLIITLVDELNQLYINRVAIGGFASSNYWSSTEFGNLSAWVQGFGDGGQFFPSKDFGGYVRAVRAF